MSGTPAAWTSTGAVRLGVRAHLWSLRPGERKVADLVLASPEIVISSSVSEVAELAGTSTATVVRAAQQLGYKGFQALKLALGRELAADRTEIADSEDVGGILAAVTAAGAQTVREAGALVPLVTFERVVELLDRADRLLFVGVGTSAPLCQDAAYRFTAIGIDADWRADAHAQALACRLLRHRDVCFAISHTGSTTETLEAAGTARAAGATIVTLTSFARSPLTELSDEVLLAGTRELGPGGLEAMTSRLAYLVLLDALIVAEVDRNADRAAAALQAYGDVLAEHRL
jgi:RpiR family carbohydrate utilization transcriptional regulator